MQNNQKIIAIFGGSGFIGKYLMRELTKLDYRIKVSTRNPYLAGYLKPLGNPGQIELFKTNIYIGWNQKENWLPLFFANDVKRLVAFSYSFGSSCDDNGVMAYNRNSGIL